MGRRRLRRNIRISNTSRTSCVRQQAPTISLGSYLALTNKGEQ
jgi:hypothetical protein